MPSRGQVTDVSLTVQYPDGSTRTFSIDPAQTIGVAWGDQGIAELLAPFYAANPQLKTRSVLEDSLGSKVAGLLMGGLPDITVTDQSIQTLWGLQENGAYLLSFIAKKADKPPCNPENP